MIKSIKVVLVLLAVLLLAACAGTGSSVEWNAVCSDPVAVADCRYGGDSDTGSHDGDGDNGEGDDE